MLILCKVGGEVIDGLELPEIGRQVHRLLETGHHIVLSHGGGAQATALSRRLGIEPHIVAGRRITDEATLEVMKMTLAGQVSVNLCAMLRATGNRPVGLHGVVNARRRPPRIVSGGGSDPIDFGRVGDVTGFDVPLIKLLINGGYLPVIACLGHLPGTTEVFNINADIVANKLARALDVDALVLLTSAPGVLRDIKDPLSRIPRLTSVEARAAIADGTVTGGMIPKLEESLAALADGVRSIYILSGDVERALKDPGSVGTILLP